MPKKNTRDQILAHKGLGKFLKTHSKNELIAKVADLGIRSTQAEKALTATMADKIAAEDRVAELEKQLAITSNALALESRISLRMEIRNLQLFEQLSALQQEP